VGNHNGTFFEILMLFVHFKDQIGLQHMLLL